MKYRDRDELVEGLRDLADFIEEKGIELPIRYPQQTFRTFVYPDYTDQGTLINGTAAKALAKAAKLLAPCKKIYGEYYFDVIRRFGPITVEFTASRDSVCTAKVVGQKHTPQRVIPAKTEDVIEWECAPSLLAVLDD